ncbi:MAG: hypothetical protein MUP36_01350, partial [Demequinaceae bacterium]|nr:hypothetical protein [Demequinaceae bacterium]
NCYSLEMGVTTDTGRWIATYPDYPFGLDGHYAPTITRIDIWSHTLQTPEGIHIGSTLAELTAAYPNLITGTPGITSKVHWIDGTLGYLVFETQDPDDGWGDPGATGPEEVILIRVVSADVNPDYTVANSGWTADACF